ncbi:hypothetical protein NQ314_018266 [Rhamnusium bicolor]|uniref:Carbohydrate kinase PfkB domain-containing protein n=1 Tax=Rhamnusium bicolor TaxID=1586634 RepID=A0AAV8WRC7_9CUCU|nr:hypothetical protein NQ314_018266 [Rhamnusium bicolor]
MLMFFETTDVEISTKPFETPHWKAVKIITPNLNELKHIASFLNISTNNVFCNNIEEAAIISKRLVNYVENVIVTLGSSGALIARKGLATESFLDNARNNKVYVRHYPANKIDNFVNVSGAGDCLASGIIAAILSGLSEEQCISVGFAAARSALYSQSAIPKEIFDKTHSAWTTPALFKTIYVNS